MVPPSTRARIASTFGTGKRYFKTTSKLVGNVAWVVTTSALLVGLPLALAIESEGMLVQQEKMMQGDAGAQQVRVR
jgi:import receptor subunit TOM22